MLKHVVMWKLKDNAAGNSKAENAREMKRRLETLAQAIPEIRRLEVGLNIKDSDRAMDVVLYSEFESLETLAAYSGHPAHQEVVTFVREIAAETRVVDYQLYALSLPAPPSPAPHPSAAPGRSRSAGPG